MGGPFQHDPWPINLLSADRLSLEEKLPVCHLPSSLYMNVQTTVYGRAIRPTSRFPLFAAFNAKVYNIQCTT